MAFLRASLIELLKGVSVFEKEVFPLERKHFESLAYDQEPPTLFITCADSRIDPNLITQTEPGELFIVRNVGNMVPAYGNMTGSCASALEYAVGFLKVKNIIVCGHSNCGAMNALMDMHGKELDDMPTVRRWLSNAEAALAIVNADSRLRGKAKQKALTEANVRLQIRHLKTHPVVTGAMARKELRIEGWYYDIPKGRIMILDDATDAMDSVEDTIARLTREK